MQSRNLFIASAVALALSAGGAALARDTAKKDAKGKDTVAQDVIEARQEAQIWTTFALSPYLRATDIKVEVNDGKALLTGTVDDEVNKDLAEQIALGVTGVQRVENKIAVKPDYAGPDRASGERAYGEVIDDATITAAVKSKLLWSRHTDGLQTDVDTRSGQVTLEGTADSATAKELAGRLAQNTPGVHSVDNRLVVRPTVAARPMTTSSRGAGSGSGSGSAASSSRSGSGSATTEAKEDVSDAWITAKVKATYARSSNVSASDISVNTNNGVVMLSGKVDSGAERALAIELAENVRGVKSVDSRRLTF